MELQKKAVKFTREVAESVLHVQEELMKKGAYHVEVLSMSIDNKLRLVIKIEGRLKDDTYVGTCTLKIPEEMYSLNPELKHED